MKINNLIQKDYFAPCKVMIIGTTKTDFSNPQLLNGFGDYNRNIVEEIKHEDVVGESFLQVAWNKPDNTLYVVSEICLRKVISEEEVEKLVNQVLYQWEHNVGKEFSKKPLLTTEEGEDAFVSVYYEEQKVEVIIRPMDIPVDHYWLGSLFNTPEKQMMYEDFMMDPIVNMKINKRLDSMKIEIPKDVDRTQSFQLPVHRKETMTGEILISKEILGMFNQFQFAQNYLRGFEPDTLEFDTGKVLMLYPRFCAFLMSCAKSAAEGEDIHDFQGNYDKELTRAIKYINKDLILKDMFENWSNVYSPKEAVTETITDTTLELASVNK